jgi:hypothetical protein
MSDFNLGFKGMTKTMTAAAGLAAALGVVLGLTLAAARADATAPEKIRIAPDKVFAPTGFDDNDNAQIVLSGAYPNTCYKVGQVSAAVDELTRKIRVRNEVYHYDSSWCLMVMVPWSQTVNLGTVPSGDYEVEFEQEDGVAVAHEKLGVSKANSSAGDDFLYAIVDEVSVETTEKPAEGVSTHATVRTEAKIISIAGHLPSSCAKLKEVKVIHKNKDVFEVLPIVEVPDNLMCQPMLRPFKTRVDLGAAAKGETLVHVRSLNGQAVNRVVRF